MQADKSLLFVKNKKQDHRPCFDVVRHRGLSPVRPASKQTSLKMFCLLPKHKIVSLFFLIPKSFKNTFWKLLICCCFAKTLHFVRGSLFSPLGEKEKAPTHKNVSVLFGPPSGTLVCYDLPAGLSTGHSIFAMQKHFTSFVAPYSRPSAKKKKHRHIKMYQCFLVRHRGLEPRTP